MTVCKPKPEAYLNSLRVVRGDCRSSAQGLHSAIAPTALDPFFRSRPCQCPTAGDSPSALPQKSRAVARRRSLHSAQAPSTVSTAPPSSPGADLRKIVFPDFTADSADFARINSLKKCCTSSVVGSSPDRSHIVVVPVRCKAWECPKCGPLKRAAWIQKIISGNPEREMTLTMPAQNCHDPVQAAIFLKGAIKCLVPKIRRQFGTFEYVLVWELTLKGVPHAHIVFRGTYIPQSWLAQSWKKLGGGYIVDIRSLKSVPARAFHATKYLAKQTGQTAHAIAPLRVVQMSKGYLPATDPEENKSKYPDHVWVYSCFRPTEIVTAFMDNPRYRQVQEHPDGTFEIWLEPLAVPENLRGKPEEWVNAPLDLDQISNVEI
ncbi:hypothetical protein ES705_38421 [subsurface metagenome]